VSLAEPRAVYGSGAVAPSQSQLKLSCTHNQMQPQLPAPKPLFAHNPICPSYIDPVPQAATRRPRGALKHYL
jgi:hypothetical protein